MIRGIGTDILLIERIQKILDSEYKAGFIETVYTVEEQKQAVKSYDPVIYYAERFSGKEAIFKCFGSSWGNGSFTDIEILRGENGNPLVTLYGKFKSLTDCCKDCSVKISFSSDTLFVVSFAILE